MAKETPSDVSESVGMRRYCFVIMPYLSQGLFYKYLCDQITAITGLKCIRADEVPGSGQPLLRKIQRWIEHAELVIADISERSPNVYYEVGFAAGRKKTMLVVCRRGTEIPTDMQGLERIEYEDTPLGLPGFDEQLRRHLVPMVNRNIRLLRAMLVGPAPRPSFILASPRGTSRVRPDNVLRFRESCTHGDNLGVVGILYALGLLLGEQERPELLSAMCVDKTLIDVDCNLYLIASPLSNQLTALAMAEMQKGEPYPWRFPTDRKNAAVGVLIGQREGKEHEFSVRRDMPVPEVDYGVVIRGPHPRFPNRRIVIMAGIRSFGTGAACLAATRPRLIRDIRNRLPDIKFSDPNKTIWALVRANPDAKQPLTEDSVIVEDAGVIGPRK